MRLTAIVLAAGASSRLGQPKQLVVLDGESLIRRAVRIAREAGCDETIVVVPPHSFGDELEGLDVTIVENRHRDEGIASSIRAGVQAAGEGRVLLMLCDQPFITAEHLARLAGIVAPIVATAYAGSAGAPAIFAPGMREDLLSLRDDRGAKAVIAAHRDECRTVSFEAAAADIDTPDDLEAINRR